MKKLIDFFIQCSNYKDPLNTECTSSGIVPRCLWDTGVPLPFPLSPAFTAGVIDGSADMVIGFKDLFMLYAQFRLVKDCWFNEASYILPALGDCGNIRKTSMESLKKLGELMQPKLFLDKSAEAATSLGSEFVTWLGQVSCAGAVKDIYDNGTNVVLSELYADLRCCQYKQGKLAFDIASMLYGAGEANAAVGVASKLSSLIQVMKGIPSMMRKINLPKLFSFKPIKTTVVALGIMFAPVEAKALQVAEVKVVNSIGQVAFEVAQTAGEKGGRQLTRVLEAFKEMELVGGGEKLAEAAAKKFVNETATEVVISVDINDVLVAVLAINKANGVVQKIVSDCDICKEKKTTEILCNKLQILRTKGGSNGEAGVKKLCAKLDGYWLGGIADKLLTATITTEEVTAFLGDVIDSKANRQCQSGETGGADLSDRVSELLPDEIDAWLVYKRGDRSCLRKDMIKLKKVAVLLRHDIYGLVNIAELAKITRATAETYKMSPDVAQRMDNEIFDNLLNLATFLEANPTTILAGIRSVFTQLQTSTFYKQKGANWVVKNIASDPATFAGKVLWFELTSTPGIFDVKVVSQKPDYRTEYKLIEYKSGPGATVCDYVNDDGKALGNLVRELVSRDLATLSRENGTLANLQWRCEQPPANLKKLIRNCLVAHLDELNKLPTTAALKFFGVNYGFNEKILESDVDDFIRDNFDNIFKIYP